MKIVISAIFIVNVKETGRHKRLMTVTVIYAFSDFNEISFSLYKFAFPTRLFFFYLVNFAGLALTWPNQSTNARLDVINPNKVES